MDSGIFQKRMVQMCIQGSQPVEGVNYFASSDLYSHTVNGSEVKLLTAIAAGHGTLRSPFYCSADFSTFSARDYDKYNWVSHPIFLMKVMLLTGINN
jgi:hypothetical protein